MRAEEDRKERRRKLGLPEELSEEEKAAERARLAESAKAKPSIGLSVKPVSLLLQMRAALVRTPRPERLKQCVDEPVVLQMTPWLRKRSMHGRACPLRHALMVASRARCAGWSSRSGHFSSWICNELICAW